MASRFAVLLLWPAFGPDTAFERNKIPAQLRFEAMKK